MSVATFQVCWIFITFYFNSGDALSCFTCSTNNQTECVLTQQKVKCLPQQKTCLSLSYESQLHNAVNQIILPDRIIKKKCISGQLECMAYCRTLVALGNNHCKAGCCTTDLCNDGRIKQQKVAPIHNSSTQIISPIPLYIVPMLYCIFLTFKYLF